MLLWCFNYYFFFIIIECSGYILIELFVVKFGERVLSLIFCVKMKSVFFFKWSYKLFRKMFGGKMIVYNYGIS